MSKIRTYIYFHRVRGWLLHEQIPALGCAYSAALRGHMCSVPPRALSPLHGARCPPLAHSRIPRIQSSQGVQMIRARRLRSSARIDANSAAACMVKAAMGGVIFHIFDLETTMFSHRARKISKSGRARSARSSAQSSSSVHGGVEACGGGGGGARAAGDYRPSDEAARRRIFA